MGNSRGNKSTRIEVFRAVEMSTDSDDKAAISPSARSAVTNRSALFVGSADGQPTDGRTIAARRFRDILASIVSDLGGHDAISEGESQMARRCATLSLQCEFMESSLIAGHPFDADQYASLTNALGRALSRIGLQRRVIDITPPLDQYLAARREVTDG